MLGDRRSMQTTSIPLHSQAGSPSRVSSDTLKIPQSLFSIVLPSHPPSWNRPVDISFSNKIDCSWRLGPVQSGLGLLCEPRMIDVSIKILRLTPLMFISFFEFIYRNQAWTIVKGLNNALGWGKKNSANSQIYVAN